jgi:hypothetical protein
MCLNDALMLPLFPDRIPYKGSSADHFVILGGLYLIYTAP